MNTRLHWTWMSSRRAILNSLWRWFVVFCLSHRYEKHGLVLTKCPCYCPECLIMASYPHKMHQFPLDSFWVEVTLFDTYEARIFKIIFLRIVSNLIDRYMYATFELYKRTYLDLYIKQFTKYFLFILSECLKF